MEGEGVGDDLWAASAVAGVQGVGEGVRCGGSVDGTMEERAFNRADQRERTSGAFVGEEIFGVPVLDVGAHAAAFRDETDADPMRDFVVNDSQVGRKVACFAQESTSWS